MKRAILVLMIVVFALVIVVPTFALSQDFHGIGVPQTIVLEESRIIAIRKAGGEGVGMEQTIVLDQGSIIAIRKAGGEGVGMEQTIVLDQGSIIAIRKSGGTQQDW